MLKVKAPRHRVHNRLGLPDEGGAVRPSLEEILRAAALSVRARVDREADLFGAASDALSQATGIAPEVFVRSFARREAQQSTAQQIGVALTAPTVRGLKATTLAVVTTERPVEFQAPGRLKVDVVIAVVGPPGDRQTQLWMFEQLSQLVLRGELLPALRDAEDRAGIKTAIEDSAARLGSMFGGITVV